MTVYGRRRTDRPALRSLRARLVGDQRTSRHVIAVWTAAHYQPARWVA